MGLNGGADKYPWLFTGTLVAMVVVSPPFALLVTKLPRKRFIPIVYRVSMACLLAFWVALKFLPESFNLAAAYTFFIWFSVFNLFVVSVFRGFDLRHVARLEAYHPPELSALDRELHLLLRTDRNVPLLSTRQARRFHHPRSRPAHAVLC